MPLLDVRNLRVSFHSRHGKVEAVRDVSFSVEEGETLAILGESGSGKSVTCLALLGLLPTPPARVEAGQAFFEGVDLLALDRARLNELRGRRVSMIFQDPMTALNPYLRVSEQLMEPLRVHEGLSRAAALPRAIAALEEVGVNDAAARVHAFPHEFSGGMRQRVMIAMAMITRPRLLIADEPTTALDVTLQAQVLELIRRLQQAVGTAVIFITHDIGVAAAISQRLQVLYAGRVMETGPTEAVLRAPDHPYTRALLRAHPAAHAGRERLYAIPGQPPDPTRLPAGCPFAPRCEFARPECAQPLLSLDTAGRATACRRRQTGDLDAAALA
jgi:oligopeptide transport system ATP-binding protein